MFTAIDDAVKKINLNAAVIAVNGPLYQAENKANDYKNDITDGRVLTRKDLISHQRHVAGAVDVFSPDLDSDFENVK